MATLDIPPWAAWRWFENLIEGQEQSLDRADLITELRTICRITSNGVRVERDMYFRMCEVAQDLMTHIDNGDREALRRALRELRKLREESAARLKTQTEDTVPRHWCILAP